MKIHYLLALVGLAIGFASPTLAQQKDTVDPKVPAVAYHHFQRRYLLNAIDNAVWSVGEWWSPIESETGPKFEGGYWSAIYVHEGDDWKIRLLTVSERPKPSRD